MATSYPIESPETEADVQPRARLFDSLFSYAALSRLLRLLGAGVLVASVSVFLYQGWENGNDIARFFVLQAYTLLLTFTGLASGYWIKESKGARLFVVLSLISVAVGYAVAGGLVYSQFQWDAGVKAYPDFARWQAGNTTNVLLALASQFVLLSPLAWLGFRVLARRSAARLTVLYLLCNAALLIPVRGGEVIGVLLGVLTITALDHVVRAVRIDRTLATPEGMTARGIQFLPLIIVTGRSFYLYAADSFLFTLIAGLAFLILRQLSLEMDKETKLRMFADVLSIVSAYATAHGLAWLVIDSSLANLALGIPVLVLVFGGLMIELSIRAAAHGAHYRRFAGIVIAAGLTANVMMFPQLLTAALCLPVGVAVMIYGYSVQQKLVFGTGLATILVGLVYQLRLLFVGFDLASWSTLALLGIGAILTASILERHGLAIKHRVSGWLNSFNRWEY
jgi:hypothetical protein